MAMNNSFIVLVMTFVHILILRGNVQIARFTYTYFIAGIMIAVIYQVGRLQLAWVYCGCVMLFFGSSPNHCLALALLVVTSVGAIVHGESPFYEWLKDLISLYCIVFMVYAITKYYRKYEKQLQQKVLSHREAAFLDALTGLPNRRAYDEKIESMLTDSPAEDRDHFLILIDIDHFKSINDKAGHDVGDAVLRRLALVLRMSAREDSVYRYGGEEFAVLLPNTTRENALIVAERLRQNVEAEQIPELQGHPSLSSLRTISLGVAGLSSCIEKGVHGLHKSADKALYESKHRGRNQIVCSPESA
jgi:diguanylate cyclase (GGDEF)-like protein